LHGLAGHAEEWADTASWLQATHRVVALDQRGHGESMRFPQSVEPAALVADVVAWLDALELERVALVGQSFGGHVAFLMAASHPERVARLVVAEASPSLDPEAEQVVRRWLESWPVPFEDRQAAIQFFGGDSLWARSWSNGLESRADGLWPKFDIDTLTRMLQESASGDWDAWQSIRHPTLIVRGEHGMSEEDATCMVAKLDGGESWRWCAVRGMTFTSNSRKGGGTPLNRSSAPPRGLAALRNLTSDEPARPHNAMYKSSCTGSGGSGTRGAVLSVKLRPCGR
jgi:pimeloyl-ACP methyl ester carboxylesterase